jgi:hypothetical protein
MDPHSIQLVGGPADGCSIAVDGDSGSMVGAEILLGRSDPDTGWARLTPGVLYRYVRDTSASPSVYRYVDSTAAD